MALKPNYIAEILEWVEALDDKEERVKLLKDNNSLGLRDILKLWFDDKLKFDLPEGAPPYTPSKPHNAPTSLFKSTKLLGNCLVQSKIPQIKKETTFIGVLEGVHPKDAELLIYVKDKKHPNKYSKTTKSIVEKAFPGLI